MKTWALAATLIIISNRAVDAAVPGDCDLTVVGQNTAPVDEAAVEAAVNGPHAATHVTVCLAGTFDFGPGITPASFVSIVPTGAVVDLEIVGLDGATIRGGFQPFRHEATSSLAELAIRDLRFVGPQTTAISIFRGDQRVEITGNHIEGVLTQSIILPTGTFTLREGIAITSFAAEIRGQIVISDNFVDGGSYAGEPTINVNAGILVAGLGAGGNPNPITGDVIIKRNLVRSWSGGSIVTQGPASVVIEDNHIEPGDVANTVPNLAQCVANAVQVVNNSNVVIRGNTIHKVPALRADGSSPACSAGMVFAVNANDNLVVSNRITGAASSAVVLGGAAGVERNAFIGNNATGLSASLATVDLGTRANNTFVGNSGTVAGNLAGNTVTGLTAVAGGVGGDVSASVGPR